MLGRHTWRERGGVARTRELPVQLFCERHGDGVHERLAHPRVYKKVAHHVAALLRVVVGLAEPGGGENGTGVGGGGCGFSYNGWRRGRWRKKRRPPLPPPHVGWAAAACFTHMRNWPMSLYVVVMPADISAAFVAGPTFGMLARSSSHALFKKRASSSSCRGAKWVGKNGEKRGVGLRGRVLVMGGGGYTRRAGNAPKARLWRPCGICWPFCSGCGAEAQRVVPSRGT